MGANGGWEGRGMWSGGVVGEWELTGGEGGGAECGVVEGWDVAGDGWSGGRTGARGSGRALAFA